MWVDENNAVHTVSVPPEEILGEESVASLRGVSDQVAHSALEILNARFDEIADGALVDPPAGPTDIIDLHPDSLPYPPCYAGPVAQPGEELMTTVLQFLEGVPPQWRIEALEAVYEALDREAFTPAEDTDEDE